MPAPIYLGDEVSAAGYRLAGVRVRVPESGTEAEVLGRARAEAPLVLVAPDLLGETPLPDLAARLRRQLGLEG
jgi:hypothetical protein